MTGGLIGNLLSFLLLYGYWALFGLEFIAALGPPFPSTAALVASGMFASQGYFSLWMVLLAGFFGNILGDAALFFLSRNHREKILRFLCIRERNNDGFIGRLEVFLEKHSFVAVAASRLSGAGSPAVSALSGISAMDPRKFITAALLGEVAYTLIYVLIGYFVAVEWGDLPNYAIPAIILFALFLLFTYRIRNRKES